MALSPQVVNTALPHGSRRTAAMLSSAFGVRATIPGRAHGRWILEAKTHPINDD
jgi:hypothetical protein